MWEWHALGHIPLRDSYAAIPHTTPPLGLRPRQLDRPRARPASCSPRPQHLDGLRRRLHTGALIWRIGGKRSPQRPGPGPHFHFQHDAGWQPGGLVSVFDNGSSPPEEKQSRGLLLAPTRGPDSVTLVKQFTNPNATLLASSQGDLLRCRAATG